MAKNKILLYGATGFMGRMIAKRADELGIPLILAGRNATRLAEFDRSLTEDAVAAKRPPRAPAIQRAFPVETPSERLARLKRESLLAAGAKKEVPAKPNALIDAALTDVRVVVNAAAPFADTADALARACIRTSTHYLDICGEYDIFADLLDLNLEAKKTGTVLLPGVGLTVLASDLLLRKAVKSAYDANMGAPYVVRVALSRVPAISRGSAKTMLESVRNGVLVGRHGTFELIPVGQQTRSFVFGQDEHPKTADLRICTAMTLADLRSAPRTAALTWAASGGAPLTVLPSIETYVEASAFERYSYQAAGEFALALRSWPLRTVLDRMLDFWPEGPPESERKDGRQQVVVEVEDRYRRAVHIRLDMPNSYDFSTDAALHVAAALLTYAGPGGFLTPAQAVSEPQEAQILGGCPLTISYPGGKSQGHSRVSVA